MTFLDVWLKWLQASNYYGGKPMTNSQYLRLEPEPKDLHIWLFSEGWEQRKLYEEMLRDKSRSL